MFFWWSQSVSGTPAPVAGSGGNDIAPIGDSPRLPGATVLGSWAVPARKMDRRRGRYVDPRRIR